MKSMNRQFCYTKSSRDGCDVVKQLKDMVHENLNVFVGACIDPPNICLVWHYCPKGSLQASHLFSFISVLSRTKHSVVTSLVDVA